MANPGSIHGLNSIFVIPGAKVFSGVSGDYFDAGNPDSLSLARGTFALTFQADDVCDGRTLFSKDARGFENGGHLTARIVNGILEVRQQSNSASEILRLSDFKIDPGKSYHLAVTFGDKGLNVFLNGQLAAAEPEFKQGIDMNEEGLAIGASTAYRSNPSSRLHEFFDGTISDVTVFDSQITSVAAAALAGAVSPDFEQEALAALSVEELMPAFAQAHHGSEVLKALATSYGFNHDGTLKSALAIENGTDGADSLDGPDAPDAINGGLGDDTISGAGDNDTLQGGYGNDSVSGGAGRDVLDGGHGEDTLDGGEGDDLLISQADGREGAIAYDPNRDEADPLNELTNGKLYPNQPIPSDDVLIGGGGADTFYFQTLINAKKRYIEEHTNDDGTIRWHGVAGENDKLHDHWVDVIGDDVIMDFDREEGDRIVIEGHTTEIGGITYGDANGDGVVDHSLIQLYSDQGNGGGAHNDDLLGTIRVYGDLVKETDITHTSKPAYGIVKSIDRLDEALAPIAVSQDTGPIAPPVELPDNAGFGLVNGKSPVFGIAGSNAFSGNRDDYLETGHNAALEVANGTIALTFNADNVSGIRTLFSKDGSGYEDGGHLTVWIKNGNLYVRQQSVEKSEYLKVPDVTIGVDQTHHLAVSFGEDGLKIYLDGAFVAAEPEFKQGLEMNDRALLVGASGTHRRDDNQSPRDPFDGTISDVMVFGSQLETVDIAGLAGRVDPALEAEALMALDVEELMPAFAQAHHGSDVLKALAAAYGFNHDGPMKSTAQVGTGTDGDDSLPGTNGADAINGGLGDDTISGAGDNDTLQGGYGNDSVSGDAGRDVLDGGHGEDTLDGGEGDDLLISQADGREGAIAYDPNRDEADPLNELTNGKLYPDQPIPADDVFIGGGGADTFYFQTLINAKKRYIEEHTNDDGTIRWHGVAGENDKLHDHWVDVIGDDVIMDFDREEGDRIVIEGHTTEIGGITYGDANGDGVVDHSLIQLYSDQGNGGGAHNDDLLGTIRVYGDLVKESDITHTSKPAYGIVKSIDRLDEALAPIAVSQDTGPVAPPAGPPANGGGVNGKTPVFAIAGASKFSGDRDDYLETGHNKALELANGTIALSFNADTISGHRALFSKDGNGYDDGGHLTVWLKNGALYVRQQSTDKSEYLKVPDIAIGAGETHHLAVSFGDEGLKIYLDGALVAAKPEFKQGLEANERSFLIGASGAYRKSDDQTPHNQFDGTISDVMVFDGQLPPVDVAGLAGQVSPAFEAAALLAMSQEDLMPAFAQAHHGSEVLKALATSYGFNHDGTLKSAVVIENGTDGADNLDGSDAPDAINGGLGDDTISGAGDDDTLQGGYGNDSVSGGAGRDVLDGGHGEDTLDGGEGDDLLISQADGREGAIAYDPNRDEGDPLNELTNGKLYPNQPIPPDDVLIGGGGADTFYFQTLINAKKRYIEEHTNDDGTIRWHGVAGENDKLHDHWVDVIGNDVIMDFDRDEGDRIVIEGHTTEIGSITYGDANGDGVVDHSLIQLYSDQGNGGGAHNDDLLGTIRVYGDLVKETDITHTSKPAYGIVKSIDRLDEALAPIAVSQDTGPIAPPVELPDNAGFGLVNGKSPVFGIAGSNAFSGNRDDYLETGHNAALEVANGTIAMTFNADTISGHKALFSKDGSGYDDGGHLTAWIQNGRLVVRQQSQDKSEYLKVPDLKIAVGQTYHLAVAFGDDGLKIYLNGAFVAGEPEFKQGLDDNERSFLVGASGHHRAKDGQTPREQFDGTISDVMIFASQLEAVDIAALAGEVDQGFELAALMAMSMEDLMPAFAQAHHGSETLRALAVAYGFDHSGTMKTNSEIGQGTDGADSLAGTDDANAINGGLGDDTIEGAGDNDTLQGGYGNDSVSGGAGRDVLDGGHGEDTLDGGEGDDLLISQADGREGAIAYDPNRDEADPLNELTNGKLYPDQPIPSDDVLIGGGGADTFYFQTLINAKKRYIEEHTNDDGTIRWHGVAGENDKLHDHWVDVIGDDVIMDFDREEGDRIVIEGHTTEIGGITYGDANGDGIVDHSLIQLYSDQGNGGGAHNDDLLGTIRVYGDLVKETDITHTSKPAYGIIKSIDDLDEALAPLAVSQDTGPVAAPAALPTIDGLGAAGNPVFGLAGTTEFSGGCEDHFAQNHTPELALEEGTIAFSFQADKVTWRDALFSKDASGNGDGGHLTAFIEQDGDLKVRFQNETGEKYLVARDVVKTGVEHDFAFTFGGNGAHLYLDGEEVAADATFTENWTDNEEVLLIGANGWASASGEVGRPRDHFDGKIENFVVLDDQLDGQQIQNLPMFADDNIF